MAVCIAVVGKDNGPIYFRYRKSKGSLPQIKYDYEDDEELQYNFIVSSSLDIIEERVQTHGKGISGTASAAVTSAVSSESITTRELYLGALTAQEEYKVFGYMTNTKIKFIVIVEETSIPLRENDIRTMFRKLHSGYCDLMLNPFYIPGSPIVSKQFEKIVHSIMLEP